MELNIEQQRAIAKARARLRMQSAPEQKPPPTQIPQNLEFESYYVPNEKEKSVGDYAKAVASVPAGIGEVALEGAAGLADMSQAGLRGIAATMPGGQTPAQAVESAQGLISYKPKTGVGQSLSDMSASAGQAAQIGAERLTEATGDDEKNLGNTLVYTALMAAPMLLGAKRAPVRSKSGGVDPAPTIQQLNRDIATAYQRADNAGLAVRGDSFAGFVDRLRQRMTEEAVTPANHPKTFAVLNDLMRSRENNQTLKGLESWRRQMRDAADTPDKPDQRLALIMRRELDDYLDNLGDADVLTGDRNVGVTALKEGRQLARRRFEAEEIGELIRRAEIKGDALYTGSGLENAIRGQFRRIVENKDWLRTFSPEVREAIIDVARGGTLVRDIGRMAPKSGLNAAASSGLGGMIGGSIAGPPGAIVGALAGPTAGALARRSATKRTTRAALMAEELARRGGTGKKVDPRVGLTAELLRRSQERK